MTIVTDLSNEPYFDDFDETKNFHRVLFKPSTAVQARELTQLQTILQNQIERFGDNILKEGTIIKGGNFVEESPLPYVKLLDNGTNNTGGIISVDVNGYIGMKVVGTTTGVEAIVIAAAQGLESQDPDLNTIYVRYTKNAQNANNENIGVFSATEQLQVKQLDINGVYQNYHLVTIAGATYANAIGNGYGVRCGDGIIYQKGNFIRFDDDLTIVSKYNNTPNGVVVGFTTEEELVTSNQDESLLDNANGFNNYQAPGADRLKLTPVLTVKTLALAKADEKFFAIQEYSNGRVVRRNLTTQYNSIEAMIEKRTSEESGDYTVSDFPVRVEQSTSNTSNLAVVVGAGIAYVNGKRAELVNDIYIETPEIIDGIATQYNQDVVTNYGHYIVANTMSGVFDSSTFAPVSLRNGAGANTGTARVRSVNRSGSLFRFYVFDVNMNSGQVFENTRKIVSAANTEATIVLETGTSSAVITDYSFKSAIFPIGRNFIKSLSANTDYVYRKSQTVSATSGGVITLSLADPESFPYSAGALNSTQLEDLLIISNAAVGSYTTNQVITPTSASLDATRKILTINITAPGASLSTTTFFNTKRIINNANITKKTLETIYVKVDCATNAANTVGPYVLGIPDAYEIAGIYKGTTYSESNSNVTSYFNLLTGQNDNYYGHSKIALKRGLTLTSSDKLLIKVKVFKRDTNINALFTVDSYPVDDVSTVLGADKIRTENIPAYRTESGKEVYLRDVIDLRPYVSNNATYASTDAAATINPASTIAFTGLAFAAPNQSIETTYDYYLGRKDLLIVNELGDFQVVNGVSAENPTLPIKPSRSMAIAKINIPPFPSLPSNLANKAGKPSYGVSISKENNKRYTMRDVGGIDQRLQNMEYYTSLNLLEKSATDLVITDSAGLNRFKNGILVDNFENLSIADLKSSEFSVSIDPSYKEINPRFRAYPIGLKVATTSNMTNYQVSNTAPIHASTLAKTDVLVVDQPYATDIRSCTTSFYRYNGVIQLTPAYDSAPDYTTAPDVNINIDLGTAFAEYTAALNEIIPLQNVTQEVVRNGRTTTTRTTTADLVVTAGAVQTVDLGDFVTNVDFNAFMRSKEVKVYITGLRPNTRFYFFFDEKDVNAHVAKAVYTSNGVTRSSEFSDANVIMSDADGVLAAVYRIPADTFFVGDRTLEVMDVPLYSSKDAASSYASKTYSGFNFSATKTGLATSTRSAEIDIVERTRTVVTTAPRRRGSDPIAQTFIIDSDLSSDDSVMVTKLDLFFAKKSVAGNGVTVQLRETVNGFPGPTAVPLSTIHVDASAITASLETASAATTVTFPVPIALKTDTEYAIVVAPDANDPDYYMWIARTGNTDVDTDVAITQDSNAGVLFTSTNNKAWTPYQNENLKFVLYRAQFTAASGYVTLTNKDNEFLRVSNVVSTNTGSYFTNDEYVFSANAMSTPAGTITLVAGNTTITGVSTAFNTNFEPGEFLVVNYNTTEYQVLKIASIANTTTMTVSDIPTANVSSANTFWRSAVGKVSYFTIGEPPMLILEDSSAKVSLNFQAGMTLVGAQSKATAYLNEVRDVPMSYIQPSIFRTNFNTTRLSLLASKLYNVSSPTYSKRFEFNNNNYLTDSATYIRSKSNDFSAIGSGFELKVDVANVSQVSKDVSPLIDHEISNVTAYEYFINNDSTNERTGSGNASSKYVSQRVELADGLDASEVRTYLTAYRPVNTNIEVYVKFQASTDQRNFEEIEWSQLSIKNETNITSSSADRFDLREFVYELGTTSKTAGNGAWLNNGVIQYIAPSGAVYNNYKYFAVKIVLLSSSHNNIPRIVDMRTLALS